MKTEKKDAEKQHDKESAKEAELKIQSFHERTGKRCLEIYFKK